MDVPNVPVSEPVEPSTGARTASASQHNTRLRRRTRESGASTAVDDAQHEKSALAPASDALPVTDRDNPPEGRVAWDTTRPGGTRASVEIPTLPSPQFSNTPSLRTVGIPLNRQRSMEYGCLQDGATFEAHGVRAKDSPRPGYPGPHTYGLCHSRCG